MRHRQGGGRVHGVVLTEDGEADVDGLESVGRALRHVVGCRCTVTDGRRGEREAGALAVRGDPADAVVRPGGRAEADHAGGGALAHPRDAVVVDVEERGGGGRQIGDHLRLRALGGFDPAEFTGMGEPDLEDDADVRLRDADEAGDVTDAARAHLDHQEPGVDRDPEHRDRCADVVVEGPLRRDGLARAGQDRAEHVLRARLAVRAGDADDPQGTAGADARDDVVREGGQRGVPVGHHDLRGGGVRRQVDGTLGDDQGGPGGGRGRHEPVSVRLLAEQGEEDAARPDETRVRLHRAVDGRVGGTADELAVDRGSDLGEGQSDHRASSAGPEFGSQPASRSAARASSRAEYGVRTPWMSR